jgi:hypothetical protein
MRAFSGQLKSLLSPQDQLFSWTGPAFLTLLDRAEPAEIQAEANRLLV